MKRALSLLLAVLLMVGLLAACGGGKEETPTSAPTSTAPTATPNNPASTPEEGGDEIELPLVEDPVTFTWWRTNGFSFEDFSNYGDCMFYQWMEDQTNVHIEFVHPTAGGERENFQTMILSGSYTDFISSVKNYYAAGVDKAIADGVIVRLNEKIDELMPNYRAQLYRDVETFTSGISDEGNIWAVHHIVDTPQDAFAGPGVRQDWLDKIGKTVDDLETMADLENVLQTFLDNGFTYDNEGPLYLGKGHMGYMNGFNGAYNISNTWQSNGMINKDGVAAFSPMEPGYKDFIGLMADWYGKGLVNKNYIADERTYAKEDRWGNGEIGVGEFIYNQGDTFALAAANSVLQPDPNFHLVSFTTPKVYKEQAWATDVHIRPQYENIRSGSSIGITTTCSDLDLACRYWNYAWSDEGKIRANWGSIGEEGDMNTVSFIDPTDANGDGHNECWQAWTMEKWHNSQYVIVKCCAPNDPVYTIWSREKCIMTDEQNNFSQRWDKAGCDWDWPESVTLTKDEGDHASSIIGACITAANEWAAAVITGSKSVDTYDTELAPKLVEMGIKDAVADYQAALDRLDSRKALYPGK